MTLEGAIAITTEVVVVDLVLLAVVFLIVEVCTDTALKHLVNLIAPVTPCSHVLTTRLVAAKVPVAAIALPSRRTMARGAAVVLTGLVSGWEYLFASSALEHV